MNNAAENYSTFSTEADPDLDSLFSRLANSGIRLWVEDGVLRFSAPQGTMTDELKARLKADKSAIIQVLQQAGPGSGIQPLEKVDRSLAIPASPEQSRLWYMDQLEDNGAYSLPLAMRIKGVENSGKITEVLQALALRHEAFRTSFAWDGSRLVQRISAEPLLEIHSARCTEAELDETLHRLAREPLSCEHPPIGRAHILELAPGDHALLLVLHHIVTDGWSSSIIAQDIITGLSQGAAALAPKEYDFADFCALRGKYGNDGSEQAAAIWWNAQLAGAPALSTFPWDLPRRAKRSGRAGTLSGVLPQELSRAFDSFLQQEKLSAFSTLNAIQSLSLAAMSGQKDVITGAPVANRQRPQEIEECVGFFANTIACRYVPDLAQDARSYLRECNAATRTALSHQSYPFELAVEAAGALRDASFLPLVQTVMAVQILPYDQEMPAGLSCSPILMRPQAARFDWVSQAWKQGGGWFMQCEYDADLYSPERAGDIFRCLQETLAKCINSPEGTLKEVTEHCAAVTEKDCTRAYEEALAAYYPETRRKALLRADAKGGAVVSLFVEKAELGWPERQEVCAELEKKLGKPAELIPLQRFPLTAGGDIDMARLLTAPLLPPGRLEQLENTLGGARLLPLPAQAAAVPDYDLAQLAPELLSAAPGGSFRRSSLVTLPPSGKAHLIGDRLQLPEGFALSLPEALEKTARTYPEQGLTLVSSSGGESFVSYAGLYQEGLRIASGLTQNGIGTGSFVLLQVSDLRLFFPAVWGCMLCGATPVTVTRPLSASEHDSVFMKLINAWKLLKQPVILHQADNLELLQSGRALFEGGEPRLLSAESLLKCEPLAAPARVGDDDIALLQLTSGSTGLAKGVQIRQRGLAVHAASHHRFNGYDHSFTSLNWLPQDHVGALLNYHITDSWLGCSQVVVSTDLVLRDPGEWPRLMEKYAVTRSWSPNFGFKLLLNHAARHPEAAWDLSKLRYLMNGGEQVTPSVLREFERFLLRNKARKEVMQPAFGMAESCSTVCFENEFSVDTAVHSYDRGMLENGTPNGDIVELVSLGRVMPGFQLKIADADGKTLPERRIGRFMIHGEVVTPGYYDNPNASAEALVGDGWLDSGDLGFVDRDRLFLTGRAKETIVLNGANYYCHELEDLLTDVPGIKPTWVAAVGARSEGAASEELGMFFVPEPADLPEESLREIINTVKLKTIEHFAVSPRWCLPLPEQQFPKGTSGKIQRNSLRLQLEQGVFAELTAKYGQQENKNSQPALLAASVEVADNGLPALLPGRQRSLLLDPEDTHRAFGQALAALADDSPLIFAIAEEHPHSAGLYGAVSALAESALQLAPRREIRCLLVTSEISAAIKREKTLAASRGFSRVRYADNGQRLVTRLAPLQEGAIASGKAWDLSLPTLIIGGLGGIGSALAEDILARGSGKLYIAARSLGGKNRPVCKRLALLGGERLVLLQMDEQGNIPRLEAREWAQGGLAINAAGGGADSEALSAASIGKALAAKNNPAQALERALGGFAKVSIVHTGSIAGFLGGIGIEAYAAAHGWLDAESRLKGQRVVAFSQWRNTGVSKGHPELDSDDPRGLRSLSSLQGVRLFWLALRSGCQHVLAGVDLAASGLAPRSSSGPVFANSWSLIGAASGPERHIEDLAGRPLAPLHCQRKIELAAGGPVLPAGSLEKSLTAIWRDVLEHDSFSPVDNFFTVGGSSLLLMRVHKQVEELAGTKIPLVALYQHPSIEALAAHLAGQAGKGDRAVQAVAPAAASSTYSGGTDRAAKRKLARRAPQAKNAQGNA